jgi:hypothetical protein
VYELPDEARGSQADISDVLGAGKGAQLIGFVIEESVIGAIRFETWRPDLCREGLLHKRLAQPVAQQLTARAIFLLNASALTHPRPGSGLNHLSRSHLMLSSRFPHEPPQPADVLKTSVRFWRSPLLAWTKNGRKVLPAADSPW